MTPDDTDDPRVLAAARDYLADLEAGRVPDRQKYLDQSPDLSEVLAEHFDGIDLAHAAGQMLRPAAPPPKVEHPAEPLGDFRIVREIGRGGMGVVYEAVQLSLGRRVALKVLPFAAGLNARQLQRFRTEAHAAAQLHHGNIVPVYAVGSERGVHFYAMQIIDGRPLDAVIREMRGDAVADPDETTDLRAGPTKPDTSRRDPTKTGQPRDWFKTAARFAEQVALALDYAHDAGVVHRDIKPANLLLDAKGIVWVTDFGLAQVSADAGLTQSGDILGTLRYTSPEQAAGRRTDVDHRTDIYSLGATLYELLTLEPMIAGTDRPAILHQVLHGEPTPLRRIDRTVPAELETIVLKAVAKVPAERYATAGEMAADLRRFLDGRPIQARRPTLFDRGKKWVRRHPGVIATAVLLLAVGVIGLGASTARVVQEQARTREALEQEKKRAAEADQRFELARRSADKMIEIGEEELQDQFHPGVQTARRRLLEAALEYYQEFIDLRRNDPTAQAELAATRDRVRTILNDLATLQGVNDLALLGHNGFHDDVKLPPERRREVGEVARKLDERRRDLFQDAGRLPADERKRRALDFARESEKAVAGVLTPAEIDRLHEIGLQVRGPMAFRDPDVVAALKLTAEQRDLVRAVEGEMMHGPGGPGGPPDRDRDRDRGPGRGWPMGGGRDFNRPDPKAAVVRITATFTPEQWAKWRELAGPPYTGSRPNVFFGPKK